MMEETTGITNNSPNYKPNFSPEKTNMNYSFYIKGGYSELKYTPFNVLT